MVDWVVVVVAMFTANWSIAADAFVTVEPGILFFISIFAKALFIIMAHHTHGLVIGLIWPVEGITWLFGIAVIMIFAVGVLFLPYGFMVLVIGVVMAPAEGKGTGSTRGLGDFLVGLPVKIRVVGNVAIDHLG
jgi:hypothetical protein